MKITLPASSLRAAVALVSKAVDAKCLKEILKNLCLHATDTALHIHATDLEVGISETISRQGDLWEAAESSSLCISADRLSAVASSLDGKSDVTLSSSDGKLTVKSAGQRSTLLGVKADDFPDMPAATFTNGIRIKGEVLARLIDATIGCVAPERERYALNGVLVQAKALAQRIEFVATDGRRLAVASGDLLHGPKADLSAIVPVKALALARRAYATSGIVFLAAGERDLHIGLGEQAFLVAQRLEGRFPPYEDIIPSPDGAVLVSAVRDELINAVRLAAITTGRDTRAVVLATSGQTLSLSSADPSVGDSDIALACQAAADLPQPIAINPDYLADGLAQMPEGSVTLETHGHASPLVLRNAQDYLYLTMPIVKE